MVWVMYLVIYCGNVKVTRAGMFKCWQLMITDCYIHAAMREKEVIVAVTLCVSANDSALAACHLLPSPDTPCECVNDSERMMVCRNDSNITLL